MPPASPTGSYALRMSAAEGAALRNAANHRSTVFAGRRSTFDPELSLGLVKLGLVVH